MMKKRMVLFLLGNFLVFSWLTRPLAVNAAEMSFIGDITVIRDGEDYDLTDWQLVLRKIGSDQVWQGGLNRDGEKLGFNLPVKDIEKNDQLILTVEAKGRNSIGREEGFFAGKTIVVTAEQLEKGLIDDDIDLEMNVIPIPAYELTDEKTMKICWKGMSDFSVIGYEIYRSDEKVSNSWQMIGRSGQNANKQVCFLDSDVSAKNLYYRLAVLSSWNAGENKEVYVSKVMSDISDGMRFGEGVTDKITRKKEIAVTPETDLTENIVSVDNNDQEIVRYWSVVDKWFKNIYAELQTRNITAQMMIILLMGLVLLLIVLYFFFSVWFSNVTSKGSNVWREK